MFAECFTAQDWFKAYSPGTQRTIKFAAYAAVSEMMRLIIFRLNSDQNESVFEDLGRELLAYDLYLQHAAAAVESLELH